MKIKRFNDMSAIKFNIPKVIWELNDIFNNNGFKLYVVGGSVRDFLIGDEPDDFDLSTDALPNEIINILSPKFKVKFQGEAFAVVVVFSEEIPEGLEIATFRIDVTKGRNPDIKIGGVTIDQDVLRRDITINALFYDLQTKEIIDLVGGEDDLKNKIIRMVGNPHDRISEDPLRILRTIRFASKYGSSLDNQTKEAIQKNNDISSISFERVWDNMNGEFMKGFKQALDFQKYINYLVEFDIMKQILPNLNINPKLENQESIVLVLAQMLRNNDVNILKNILKKCSISSNIINKVIFLIKLLHFDKEKLIETYQNKERFDVDNNSITKWLDLNNMQQQEVYKFLYYRPTIDSRTVMNDYNIKQGRELGIKIKELEIELFNNITIH